MKNLKGEFLKMYEALTNEDTIKENKRKHERNQRIADRRADFGYERGGDEKTN